MCPLCTGCHYGPAAEQWKVLWVPVCAWWSSGSATQGDAFPNVACATVDPTSAQVWQLRLRWFHPGGALDTSFSAH